MNHNESITVIDEKNQFATVNTSPNVLEADSVILKSSTKKKAYKKKQDKTLLFNSSSLQSSDL